MQVFARVRVLISRTCDSDVAGWGVVHAAPRQIRAVCGLNGRGQNQDMSDEPIAVEGAVGVAGDALLTEVVEVFTDGACKGNPGRGGWGVLLRTKGSERELFGGEPMTTNNRMELRAAIEGLNALKRRCKVRLVTDSEYVRRGITEWLPNWRRRGWRTAASQPVKNADLWQLLEAAAAQHDVTFEWVRGHSGHPENERADALANRGIAGLVR